MAHKYQEIANQYAGKACKLYTLDGVKDAIICGRLEKVGKVTSFSFLAKHVLHSTRRERAP